MKRGLLLFIWLLTYGTEVEAMISTADWNTNAAIVIKARDDAEDPAHFLIALTIYTNKLMQEANQAAQDDNRERRIVFLIISYFNVKLAQQIMVDNKGSIQRFDDLELEFRKLLGEIRVKMLDHNFRTTDSYFAMCFKEYRRPFGNRTELILRAP